MNFRLLNLLLIVTINKRRILLSKNQLCIDHDNVNGYQAIEHSLYYKLIYAYIGGFFTYFLSGYFESQILTIFLHYDEKRNANEHEIKKNNWKSIEIRPKRMQETKGAPVKTKARSHVPV